MIPDRRMWYEGMTLVKSEAEWAERAKRFLKAELERADVTYEQLAEAYPREARCRKRFALFRVAGSRPPFIYPGLASPVSPTIAWCSLSFGGSFHEIGPTDALVGIDLDRALRGLAAVVHRRSSAARGGWTPTRTSAATSSSSAHAGPSAGSRAHGP